MAPTIQSSDSLVPKIVLQTISPCPPKHRGPLAKTLTTLEKKLFPSSEAFDYVLELKKPNIGVILAYASPSPPSPNPKSNPSDQNPKPPSTPIPTPPAENLIGYLIFQRLKGVTWIHKLGVVERERRKGIGRRLVEALMWEVKRGGGRKVVLWVDEGREGARALYRGVGFEEGGVVEGYYGVGRGAVKMEVEVEAE
ncbi:hypothetical protein BU23DRAFT_551238 [Bimuria novae-zelandiae CBS 107.79]|uniref:N-acetyltransferase domain-containing protein n=1 Tax=Bimuria novae-zelandiae CBS 107.79 TaxID=1447943 RepID=A0A6A5VM49_9PLEO|nr:hypothetical protein BU23DRAFT_551238 [Bimuria novae-zelandiae CBS 107.79]